VSETCTDRTPEGRDSFRRIEDVEIRSVGVVGLGTMGAGIAQVAIEAGFPTVGREIAPELGESARGRIEQFLNRKVEKGQLDQAARDETAGRLRLTTELAELAECDLVVEAVLEEPELKREVFAELDHVLRPEAIIATNTSALSVTELAAATGRPGRVVGTHFFNPAPLMPLVEVVRTELVDDAAYEGAFAFVERLGKTPIRCNDTPGFVVNRVLIPLLNDCVRVLDEARITPEDLDRGMKHGAGWPMGPCALVDLIGIDIHVHASEALYDALREPRMAPPARLVRMAQAGHLGRKSGRGFFAYGES
jgi:3-hydroxybutyryl-CoA dehydrogenase